MIKEIFAIAVLANKAFMFVMLFTLARILGVELYGVFSYHYAIVTGIATVVGESLSVALSRYAVLNVESINYKTSLSLMLCGGLVAGGACLILLLLFPAPASSYEANAPYIMGGAFLLAFACVCNLTITGLMFCLSTSARWVAALSAHGLLGLLFVVAFAMMGAKIELIILMLALCTCIAPLFGFLAIKQSQFSYKEGKQKQKSLSFGSMTALFSGSGMPAIAGSMLLGAPVHIICLIIFANTNSSFSEVGYFNLFFLIYILVTVLPSSLTSYAVTKLAGRGTSSGRLYLMIGATVSVCLPVLMIFSQSYWLCLLGRDFCEQSDLLVYAVISGGIGLTTTIITQILHSKNTTKTVFWGSCVYACVYLSLTIIAGFQGEMMAVDLFRAFVLALAAQIVFLVVLSKRQLAQC